MKKAYFISGLGADQRLFKEQIDAGIPIVVIHWLIPLKNESIQSYALRMSSQITEKGKIILGGVSFGGMMAIEISKLRATEKVIIISSVKTHHEIPLKIKIWNYIPIYKILGGTLLKKAGILFRYIFGKLPLKEKSMFIRMVNEADPTFIEWAADKICSWQNEFLPDNLIHIHGRRDFIFPIKNIQLPCIEIHNGTHLMIMTASDKINAVLKKELSGY